MGMSTHVIGFRPPDERWHQMKNAHDALLAAGLPLTTEIELFFENCHPDPSGQEVDIERTPAVKEWSDEHRSGFEIDIRKLPPECYIVRVYNSW